MIAENLKKIRNLYNYSLEEMALLIEIPSRTLAAYERKERTPSILLAQKLAEKLNVNINWLLTGEGEIFQKSNQNIIKKNNEVLNMSKSIGKRLNSLLIDNNISDIDFSKITGISESRTAKLILDTASITFEEICAIKSNFDISADWLLFGEKERPEISLSEEEIIKLKDLLRKN